MNPLTQEVQNALAHIRQALEPVETRGHANLAFYANSATAFNIIVAELENANKVKEDVVETESQGRLNKTL